MATIITNPLLHDLTFEACAYRSEQPLYTDATVSFRFQLRDEDDVAVSLSGATVSLILSDSTTTVTRTTADLISGSTYKVKADTDQSTETGDTGKGWYQCNFLPAETELDALVGRRRTYKVKVLLGDGTVIYPHFAGKVDIGS